MSIEERIEVLRIFAEIEDFDFIREMSSEQLWKLMLIACMVLDVGKKEETTELKQKHEFPYRGDEEECPCPCGASGEACMTCPWE